MPPEVELEHRDPRRSRSGRGGHDAQVERPIVGGRDSAKPPVEGGDVGVLQPSLNDNENVDIAAFGSEIPEREAAVEIGGDEPWPAVMVKGSLGRMQVSNWALRRAGRAQVTDEVLREALASFFEHHQFLDVARMRPVPHEAYYANAAYFYMFAHCYAAQAINELPVLEANCIALFDDVTCQGDTDNGDDGALDGVLEGNCIAVIGDVDCQNSTSDGDGLLDGVLDGNCISAIGDASCTNDTTGGDGALDGILEGTPVGSGNCVSVIGDVDCANTTSGAFCPKCGAQAATDSRFCGRCGASLPTAAA